MGARRVVRVVVPAGEAELAADALWQAAPSAVTSEDLDGGRVRLIADVEPAAAAYLPWPVEIVEVDADAGLDAWRDFARPVRVGGRLLLQPAWLPSAAAPGDLVVQLDPGHAFGSGSHPTTQLVLAGLEDHIHGGERVLDVGCGSGVLSVAACLLGAAHVDAIDVELPAVEATRSNAAANGVADRVRPSADRVEELDGRYDVVVANILGGVLRGLAQDIAARLEPGGVLLLAGFLDEQAAEVRAAYAHLHEVERRARGGWTSLTLRARGGPRRPPSA